MAIAQRLAREMIRYLQGEISSAKLRENIASLSWGAPVWGDEHAKEIAGSAELALSEFEAGHLSEQELKEELRRHCILIAVPQAEIMTGASVTQIRIQAWSPWANRQSAGESVWPAGPRA